MGFTGAHVLYTFDAFILALYLLFLGCALLKYTCKQTLTSKLVEWQENVLKGKVSGKAETDL